MNLTFQITQSFEYEFTTSNLINSDLVIERISISSSKYNLGTCLLLDILNNNVEQKQGVFNSLGNSFIPSPMVCINKTYQSDHFNTVIPKTRKWRFYMMNKAGQYISLKTPLIVSIHFSIKEK